jgi:hypothetical protein
MRQRVSSHPRAYTYDNLAALMQLKWEYEISPLARIDILLARSLLHACIVDWRLMDKKMSCHSKTS